MIKLVSNMKARLYKRGDLLIERETEVDQLYFLYVGVAHIYGYMEIEGELLRYKIVTLKKGSWYGDF